MSRKYNFGSSDVNFHDAYYQARSTAYYGTAWGEECFDHESKESFETFNVLKVVFAASLKKQVHNGTTLMELYTACRESFKIALAAEKPEFRNSLQLSLTNAVSVFEKVKNPEFRKELQDLDRHEMIERYGYQTIRIEEMLGENASPEEIVKQAQLEQKQDSDAKVKGKAIVVEKSRDRDLEKFALRRFNEDKVLVDKYLAVARLALEDVKSIK